VPIVAKTRFVTPCEGFCGRQATRKPDSRPHPRGLVGAKTRESRFREALGAWVPKDAKPRFVTPPEGCCGRQPCRSPRPASEGRAVWVSNAALPPGAAWAGLVELSVNGRFILRISPQSSCLARSAPRTGKAARGAGARRPALDPAGRPARAARLLRPRIVFLCPPIMRDRPEKVKPRFVPDNEPCRRPPSSRSAAPFLLSPRSRAGGRVAHNPRRRNTCLQGSQVLTGTGFAVSRPADCRSARELLE